MSSCYLSVSIVAIHLSSSVSQYVISLIGDGILAALTISSSQSLIPERIRLKNTRRWLEWKESISSHDEILFVEGFFLCENHKSRLLDISPWSPQVTGSNVFSKKTSGARPMTPASEG